MSRKDELQAEWHKLHALKGDERHPLGGYLPRAVEALDNGDTRECRNLLMLALYGYALPGAYRCPIADGRAKLQAERDALLAACKAARSFGTAGNAIKTRELFALLDTAIALCEGRGDG